MVSRSGVSAPQNSYSTPRTQCHSVRPGMVAEITALRVVVLERVHILQASVFSRPHEQISTRARHPLARE
ncbi:uncharacterized protein TrAFT101_003302 [Trichoderma asperellum]|uniref:uncharacterized protein n=1 Tax=Trichoderma asperellum TaxID=101201 RepID=UPI00331E1639|nr:hypothetical protein TrAFT101_003302 [Trichoderma asperellum]